MALAARAVGRVHVYDVEQRPCLVEIERVEALGEPRKQNEVTNVS
jgi:hypothetical protein